MTDRDIRIITLELACEIAKRRFREIEVAERDVHWLLGRPSETTLAMLHVAKDNLNAARFAFERAWLVVVEGATSAGLADVAALDDSGSPPVDSNAK